MRIKSIILVALFITGCASKNEPQYNWVKSGATSKDHSIESSLCKAEAYKAIPIQQNGLSECVFMSGISGGVCAGNEARQRRETGELREEIYDGCMLGKGWQKRPLK